MEKDIAGQLSEFTVHTKLEDIPDDILEFTKCLTLKTVAGMLAGSITASAQKMASLIREKKLPEEVGIIGSDFKTSLWEAVLLGAYFAHANELEDDRYIQGGGVSWDITVIPLILSLAEKLDLSGKDILEALVTGLEVHARTCQFSTQHRGVFVMPGAIGPAVGAAKALKLSMEQTRAAFGLALAGVPISMVNFGTDAHYFESALQAHQGVVAAEMAKVGLTGNPDLTTYLNSQLGTEYVYPEEIVRDLGKKWFLKEIQIKKYPCCLANHRQIDLVIEMRKAHSLTIDDVEVIEMHSRRKGDYRNDRPDPKTEQDLQFSFQHNLGVAMLYGDLGIEHFTPEAVSDPKMVAARSKVKFIPAPDDAPEDSVEEPACVVIKTKDGRVLIKERKYAIGSFFEPLEIEQFRDLYLKFTKDILPETAISKSMEVILNLEKMDSVKQLTEHLIKL